VPRLLTLLGRHVLTCVVASLACTIPTTLCGCPPARSTVFVRGSLTDAAGQTVGGARLYFDGVPASQSTSFPVYVGGPGDTQTDGGGTFATLIYSPFSPGQLVLRAAVVRPGLPDTVTLSVGGVTFRNERETPETVSVALHLP